MVLMRMDSFQPVKCSILALRSGNLFRPCSFLEQQLLLWSTESLFMYLEDILGTTIELEQSRHILQGIQVGESYLTLFTKDFKEHLLSKSQDQSAQS